MEAAGHANEEPSRDRAREVALGGSVRDMASVLVPEDRERFLGEYDRLIQRARSEQDIEPVLDLIERWRGVAVLQADPERYLRHLRRAAELVTGGPVPEGETVNDLRMRVGA